MDYKNQTIDIVSTSSGSVVSLVEFNEADGFLSLSECAANCHFCTLLIFSYLGLLRVKGKYLYFTICWNNLQIVRLYFNGVVAGCTHLYLSFHSQTKQCNEVHYENWPKHRHIKNVKECTNQADYCTFRHCVPELEFW